MTSKKITNEFKRNFIVNKVEHDSVSQAIKLAKSKGWDEKGLQPLVQSKIKLLEQIKQGSNKLLRGMQLSNNIIDLPEGWHGVRYVNSSGDEKLKLEFVNKSDIPILKRDCRHERELSETDLETLVPGCIDELLLSKYKADLLVRAEGVLAKHFCIPSIGEVIDDGVISFEAEQSEYVGRVLDEVTTTEDSLESLDVGAATPKTTISIHAGTRYVQRKLEIGVNNDIMAEDYYRRNADDITQSIMNDYHNEDTILMWTDAEGIEYRMGLDNIMYVVGNYNIITLYVEDFGFTPEINRMIALKQREVLEGTYQELQGMKQVHRALEVETARELDSLESNIQLLEAQRSMLISKRSEMLATRERSGKEVEVLESQYRKEFSKLFKKWKK